MKTSQNEILSCLSELRDYLVESHQDEIDRNHYGDTTGSCSYCQAIARADSILAASSSPDDSPTVPRSIGGSILEFICERLFEGGEMPLSDERLSGGFSLRSALDLWRVDSAPPASSSDRLARFGELVLEHLEVSSEWSGDTVADISDFAVYLGLANSSGNDFKRVAAPPSSIPVNPETLAEASEVVGSVMARRMLVASEVVPVQSEASIFPLLMITHDRAEVVAVDIARNESELEETREMVREGGDFTFSAVPLSLSLLAPALRDFVARLSDGGHHAGAETAECARQVLAAIPAAAPWSGSVSPVITAAEAYGAAPARKALERLERVSVETVKAGGPGVAQVLAHYEGGGDAAMAFGAVRAFHICPVCGWFVAELFSGAFWTLANNHDTCTATLESALAWLRREFVGA